MKIISGRFKGRNFYAAKGSKARPTSTMVREALFNILYGKVTDSVVIDLFAGSGGFGLEALSRGASKVCFCDYDRKVTNEIQKYTDEYKLNRDEYDIYPMDYQRAMSRMESDGVLADIIYIDPPYKSNVYENILEKCVPLIKIDGTVIIEHDKRTSVIMTQGYESIQTKQYGGTGISIFRYEGAK